MAKNDKVLLDGIIDDRISLKLPSAKRDEAFEYLSFEQLLKDFDLSHEEILSGSIDGRRDGGIDGFFILVNGLILQDPESFVWPRSGADLTLFIISSKHHDTFKQATLDSLVASLTELLDFGIMDRDLKGAYSEPLLRMRNNLKYAYRKLSPRLTNFSIKTYYASRGDTQDIGEEVRSRAYQIQSLTKDSFGSCHSEFNFIGSTELVELHRKTPNYTLELPFLEVLAKGERYVLLAGLADYYNFISDDGKLRRYLFDSNVRDFMGMNRVNEDIKATLDSLTSTDFWWLNNGVTILATSASVIGKSIQVSDIQIVNGLQTTESIFRYFNAGGRDPQHRCVLVKVIVSKDDAVRDSIIRATNNQTDVELASLHATDKIQRDIEDVLHRHSLYYERRKNYYANMGHTPSEIVTPLYVAAGYINLILKLPYKAAALRSKFMRSPEAYDIVFSNRAPIEVWPKIARIHKQTDNELEKIRPSLKGTEKFLKSWRYLISFLIVSESLGRFDFTAQDLLSVDASIISEKNVKNLWAELSIHSATRLSAPWTIRANVMDVCREFNRHRKLSGLGMVLNRPSALLEYVHASRTTKSLSEDFIAAVKAALPAQPWKPQLHKEITALLGCSKAAYFSAVESLIEDGHFYRQRDGVLYDTEGNVVAIDIERVDPETLKLRNPEIN